MQNKDLIHLAKIKEFLINEYQGASDNVKKRIKILLRNEVIDYHKCEICGHKFDTNSEDNMKSSITIFEN